MSGGDELDCYSACALDARPGKIFKGNFQCKFCTHFFAAVPQPSHARYAPQTTWRAPIGALATFYVLTKNLGFLKILHFFNRLSQQGM